MPHTHCPYRRRVGNKIKSVLNLAKFKNSYSDWYNNTSNYSHVMFVCEETQNILDLMLVQVRLKNGLTSVHTELILTA